MCLTDGEIYIGATYNPPKFFDLDNFNIVKITGQYFDRMKPMYALFNLLRNIKTLEILSRTQKKLIGNSPCTLVDYFNKEISPIPDPEPRKRVKLTQDDFVPIILSEDTSPLIQL